MLDVWNIIDTITAYIDWIIFFSIMNINGTKKISNIRYLLRVSIILFGMGLINISNMFPNTKIVLCIVTGILFCKFSYENSIAKSIIMNLLFWLGLMFIEVISTGVVVMLNNLDSIQSILTGSIYRIQAIFISKILLFMELILLKYFKLSLEFKFKDVVLIGLPILSNIVSLLLVFGYNFNQNIHSKSNLIVLAFTVLLMIASSIMLLIVIGKIVKDDKLKLEYELINERINLGHKNYENMIQAQEKLRYVYHDLKNHIIHK